MLALQRVHSIILCRPGTAGCTVYSGRTCRLGRIEPPIAGRVRYRRALERKWQRVQQKWVWTRGLVEVNAQRKYCFPFL